jgi:cytochrome P450
MSDDASGDDIFSILNSEATRRDPYPTYDHYRSAHGLLDIGMGVWFAFRYDDCNRLLRDSELSVDERHAIIPGPGDDLPTLIHLDPPDHERLRRLVQMAFTPRAIETVRRRAEQLVTEHLDRFRAGDEIDIIDELAYPVPLTIICEMLGIDQDRRDQVRQWSTWLARSIDPGALRSPELNIQIAQAQDEFVAEMQTLVRRKRTDPGDDLLSQLVSVEASGDRLTETELVGLAVLLLVAGHETTVSLIGNGLHALLANPAQLEAVNNDAVTGRDMIDELLRYDSPVQMTTRIPRSTIDLSGASIPAGHIIVLMLGAANHDPTVFEHGDQLNVHRSRPAAHLAFGSGIHHCLGATLARAEGEAALTQLIRRFPTMTMLNDPPLRPTFVLRGRAQMMVRL